MLNGVMAFKEAEERYGLKEGTLRKRISYSSCPFVEGQDYIKSGSTYLITDECMEKHYKLFLKKARLAKAKRIAHEKSIANTKVDIHGAIYVNEEKIISDVGEYTYEEIRNILDKKLKEFKDPILDDRGYMKYGLSISFVERLLKNGKETVEAIYCNVNFLFTKDK